MKKNERHSIKLTTTVNNLDDLIQLQTTESDNTREILKFISITRVK